MGRAQGANVQFRGEDREAQADQPRATSMAGYVILNLPASRPCTLGPGVVLEECWAVGREHMEAWPHVNHLNLHSDATGWA